MSDNATIGKTIILQPASAIAATSISFATGATAATIVSAYVAAPAVPVSEYIVAITNNATQTNINVQVNNVRSNTVTSAIPYQLANVAFSTGQSIDTLLEGMYGGKSSGVLLRFSLGSAATAAEIVSADYQIWAYR